MDPNIDMETGESTSSGRSPRFSLWTAFLVFATIVMISAIQVVCSCLFDPSVPSSADIL